MVVSGPVATQSVAELFEPVWGRIVSHQTEFFKTGEGNWFTYRVHGNALRPSRTELSIPRLDLERAFPLLPIPPAKLNKFVTGPAYVWAILHDPRISAGHW